MNGSNNSKTQSVTPNLRITRMKDETTKVAIVLIPLDSDGKIEHAENCPLYEKKSASTGVVSNAYRNGWDAIFGKRQPVGSA